MGFLDRAIRRGVSEAVGKAVETKVTEAVVPEYTKRMNAQAQAMNEASANMAQAQANQTAQYSAQAVQSAQSAACAQSGVTRQQAAQAGSVLAGMFGGMQTYATQMASQLKACPSCGASCPADKKFCPSCGTKLPEKTIAEQMTVVCQSCGTKNEKGTAYCSECGALLPVDPEDIAVWPEGFGAFPQWTFPGDVSSDIYDNMALSVNINPCSSAMLDKYKQVLIENGFKSTVDKYGEEHIWKVADNHKYDVDVSMAFESGAGNACLLFHVY